jgi:hypothetical protein
MTPDELIAEGRALQRPCLFLTEQRRGPVTAVWYAPDAGDTRTTGERCWLTVDAGSIPGLDPELTGYASVFTDQRTFEGGRVEIAPSWPSRPGTKLYAHAASVLPPIDAVFARGSDAVGAWIRSYGWDRNERYSNGFGGDAVVQEYERVWQAEFPLYHQSEAVAVLGGWHWPGPDADWHDLVDDRLMVLTLRDAEPWVEAWQTRAGAFRVIQRVT